MYTMFFPSRNFVSGLICTLKSKKNLKTSKKPLKNLINFSFKKPNKLFPRALERVK